MGALQHCSLHLLLTWLLACGGERPLEGADGEERAGSYHHVAEHKNGASALEIAEKLHAHLGEAGLQASSFGSNSQAAKAALAGMLTDAPALVKQDCQEAYDSSDPEHGVKLLNKCVSSLASYTVETKKQRTLSQKANLDYRRDVEMAHSLIQKLEDRMNQQLYKFRQEESQVKSNLAKKFDRTQDGASSDADLELNLPGSLLALRARREPMAWRLSGQVPPAMSLGNGMAVANQASWMQTQAAVMSPGGQNWALRVPFAPGQRSSQMMNPMAAAPSSPDVASESLLQVGDPLLPADIQAKLDQEADQLFDAADES